MIPFTQQNEGAYCIDDATSEDPANVACKTGTVSQEPSFSQTEQPGCYVDRYVAARGNPNEEALDILIRNHPTVLSLYVGVSINC